MYELFRSMTSRVFAAKELPAFLLALAIAEVAYKFKSFLLEALAFVATWFVLSAANRGIATLLSRK